MIFYNQICFFVRNYSALRSRAYKIYLCIRLAKVVKEVDKEKLKGIKRTISCPFSSPKTIKLTMFF